MSTASSSCHEIDVYGYAARCKSIGCTVLVHNMTRHQYFSTLWHCCHTEYNVYIRQWRREPAKVHPTHKTTVQQGQAIAQRPRNALSWLIIFFDNSCGGIERQQFGWDTQFVLKYSKTFNEVTKLNFCQISSRSIKTDVIQQTDGLVFIGTLCNMSPFATIIQGGPKEVALQTHGRNSVKS